MIIQVYNDDIAANGKPVPDGAVTAKVEWAKQHNTAPPYPVTVHGPLIEVSFMVRDAKRFPGTNGWGYTTFRLDAASGTLEAVRRQPGVREHLSRVPYDCERPRLRYTSFAQR